MRHQGRPAAYGTSLALAGLLASLAACQVGDAPYRAGGAVRPGSRPSTAPACQPASLQRQAAATLIVGLPDTLRPSDPLALSMPALGVGGILLTARNVQSAAQVRALTTALRERHAGPLLIAADEEGGRVTTLAAVIGNQPSARASSPLGAAALRQRATVLGRQLRSLGVTVDFAPVLDITAGPDGAAIGDRSYSADPQTAGDDALAVARGLASGGVTPVLKHFPGLGAADADTHLTAPVVLSSAASLAAVDLHPFVQAIAAGAPAVMVGHAEYPALGDTGVPASLSSTVYRKLKDLAFRGVTITDSLGMGAVNLRYDFPAAAVKALSAGTDALLTTDGSQAPRMRDAIVAAVRRGQLPASRLADAAARVTALAGGDPYELTCRHVTLPQLH